ncbi:MAG: DEAD/DEAH box helicase [Actinobacteria bacterium]|nr:DEAD/DEAH box helicase [Actinomycetota bacterium]
MSFESLGLEPRLLQGVAAMGYTEPTAIQREAIPHILRGSDVVGAAQTGTGKTAAFVLPMLQRTPIKQGVRALIVTPTRELALQIDEVIRTAAKHTRHRTAVIIGGVGMYPQIDRVRRGVDIVVACPGRLLDIHSRRILDLSRVETLVLDEADRMLDMGFWPDVSRILGLLPAKRQNLLFSATMSAEVLRVVQSTLHDPVRVETSPVTTPVEQVDQTVYPVGRHQKTELLVRLLQGGGHRRTLVFTRTKHGADKLSRQLEKHGLGSAAIHGGRSQAQRQRALGAFRAGQSHILVATDVVARGIDVDNISHVVNYDMPNTPEDYVHRIGRTARAGAEGSAVSFLAIEELERLAEIEQALGMTIPCHDLEGFAYGARVVPDPARQVRGPKGSGGGYGGGSGGGNRHRSRQGGAGRSGRRR